MKPKVAVIMGSDSDLKYMNPAIEILKDFKVPHEVQIVSAHRNPHNMRTYAMKAQQRGLEVIIAGAGGAAHLPGMVASFTLLPVVGVPIWTSAMEGMDSLLSVVQMPKGVPVAGVAVNGAQNSALLAIRILAVRNKPLLIKLKAFQKKQKQIVTQANKKLKKK